jgi:hypothetical protein
MYKILIYGLIIVVIIILLTKKYYKIEKIEKFVKEPILINFPKKIYMFWDNGWDNAPYMCVECLKSWRRYNSDWEIITLDNNNIEQYLDKDILKKINEIKRPQHRADLIRVNLLNKNGGVWIDASIFCNRTLDSWLYEYMKEGIFYFKYNKESGLEHYKIGNWFIACEKNNYLMNKFCTKFNTRWKYIISDEYFGFHKVFKELCDTDVKFNNIYQSIPFYDARLPRITIQSFHNVKIELSDEITNEIEDIIKNTDIPMFKFRSSDKCPKKEIKGTVFQYLIEKNKFIT